MSAVAIILVGVQAAGRTTLVDEADAAAVSGLRWHLTSNGYACTTLQADGKAKHVRLHRMLLAAPRELEVDHINGDVLDNRRANLRLTTRAQNQQNLTRIARNSKTGVRGVFFDTRRQRYTARVKLNRKFHHFGYHLTLEDAALAAQEGRRLLMTHAAECGVGYEHLTGEHLKRTRAEARRRSGLRGRQPRSTAGVAS